MYLTILSTLSVQANSTKCSCCLSQMISINYGSMSSSVQLLEEQPQLQAWSDLAQATLARLVMFNKRRGGEASKMLLSSYLSRPDWTKVNNPEIMSALSSFERELSRR